MAGIAAQAVIDIAPDALVFVIHSCLGMFMTVQAAEQRIVRGVGMTIVAAGPFSGVAACVDWKLVGKHRAAPAGR